MRTNGMSAWILVGFISMVPAASAQTAAGARTLQEKLGYPRTAKLLIIHADDLGMAHSVNQATFEALEKGWVTSASVMVPTPWFPEVVRWAKAHPEADLGIHLTLDSEWTGFRWGPVAPSDQVASLLDAAGYLPLDPELLHGKLAEVERELHAQIERARASGIQPTHFDSHMLALTSTPEYFNLYVKVGHEYKVPIRLAKEGESKATPDLHLAADEVMLDQVLSMNPGVSQTEWAKWYREALAALQPGVYELVVHLAHDDAEMQGATWDHPDWGATWRQSDFNLVGSAEFSQFLRQQGFTLVHWRDLGAALVERAPSRR